MGERDVCGGYHNYRYLLPSITAEQFLTITAATVERTVQWCNLVFGVALCCRWMEAHYESGSGKWIDVWFEKFRR